MGRVSIIIPFHDVADYLAEAIRSTLAQTYQDFELLLVDDGSKDGSLEVCRSFLDQRIRVFSQQHRGLAAARNVGIRNSTGELIAFLDGDDSWLPEKLERQLRALDNAPDGTGFRQRLVRRVPHGNARFR